MNILVSQVTAQLWHVGSVWAQRNLNLAQASVTSLSLGHQIHSAVPLSSYKPIPVVPNGVAHS